jgi:hypothetical protein
MGRPGLPPAGARVAQHGLYSSRQDSVGALPMESAIGCSYETLILSAFATDPRAKPGPGAGAE